MATPTTANRRRTAWRTAVVLATSACLVALGGAGGATGSTHQGSAIRHLVVLFDENISFDHYFGSYPHATDADGTPFHARPGTPQVNGLTPALLRHNPNSYDPKRLGPAQAYTCDQDHSYDAEQQAFNGGLMNEFVQHTEGHNCAKGQYTSKGLVMDYFDGNTVTALWNYAQHYALSDNTYGTNFGPSTPGAINLISGNTHGAVAIDPNGKRVVDLNDVASPDSDKVGTLVSDPDPDPMYDDCSGTGEYHAYFTGRNVGDLLNARHVSWGWFEGGFRPTGRASTGMPVCGRQHQNVGSDTVADYSPHHEPFQYYKSTANPRHLPPSSVAAIGHQDQANHQYGLTDLSAALRHGNLPTVSFVKARAFQDGHAGYSSPLDEQHFLAGTVNAIQRSSAWPHTMIVIAYDDSDGWYDHAMSPILNPSNDPRQDWLSGQGHCGAGEPMNGYQDRCGYGPRLPLLVISRYARPNHVDHALTDQTSVLRFIEDTWLHGARVGDGSYDHLAGSIGGMLDLRHPHAGRLILDPITGAPAN